MTEIILAFQGVGKTTFAREEEESGGYRVLDLDFKLFDKDPGWEDKYISSISEHYNNCNYDYILGNISPSVICKLVAEKIPFTVVTPVWYDDVAAEPTSSDFFVVKERLFGRYVLRKCQDAHNVNWLEYMKCHYNEWTKYSNFSPYISKGLKLMPLTSNKLYIKYYI